MTDFDAVLAEWWNATPKQELPVFAGWADRLAAAHAAELGELQRIIREHFSRAEREMTARFQAETRAEAAEQGWQRMTDAVRDLQRQHRDNYTGDVYHAMQFVAVKHGAPDNRPMIRAIDAQQAEGPDA